MTGALKSSRPSSPNDTPRPLLWQQEFPPGTTLSQERLEALEETSMRRLVWALTAGGTFGVLPPVGHESCFSVEGGDSGADLWIRVESLIAVTATGRPLRVTPDAPLQLSCPREGLSGSRLIGWVQWDGWEDARGEPLTSAPLVRVPRLSLSLGREDHGSAGDRLAVCAFRRHDVRWVFEPDFVPHSVAMRATDRGAAFADRLADDVRHVPSPNVAPEPTEAVAARSRMGGGRGSPYNAERRAPQSPQRPAGDAEPWREALLGQLERRDLRWSELVAAVRPFLAAVGPHTDRARCALPPYEPRATDVTELARAVRAAIAARRAPHAGPRGGVDRVPADGRLKED